MSVVDVLKAGLGIANPISEVNKVTAAIDPFGVANHATKSIINKVTGGGAASNSATSTTPGEKDVAKEIDKLNPNNPQDVIKAEFLAFGNGKYDFQPAIGAQFQDTASLLAAALKGSQRANTPPSPLDAWECRIGGTKLFVPPINISVNQNFQTGALTGAVLRQRTPPKFNSGYSQTMISMNLYFPNADQIWGFAGNDLKINFDTDDDSVVDYFLGSLRGLITQFRYAPFLPVKNAYLNGTFNITGVVMHSMTVSTMQGFPFCIQVQLNMLKFNHEVYLPMIDDFEQAIHWGRYRQYIGRAANTMEQAASRNFLTLQDRSKADAATNIDDLTRFVRQDLIPASQARKDITQPYSGTVEFNKAAEWEDGRFFDFYYPDHDPSAVRGPDLSFFQSGRDPDSAQQPQAQKSWWESLLGNLGFNITSEGVQSADQADQTQRDMMNESTYLHHEWLMLEAWIKRTGIIADTMGPGQLEEYIQNRMKDLGPNPSPSAVTEMKLNAQSAWFGAMYQQYIADPWLQNALAYQQRKRGWLSVLEWEVPMIRLGLDPNNVIVTAANVTMANNIIPLQLSMMDEPTYQHLGGLETKIEIALTVFGENDLTLLRRMFETVNGLARLEHGHAILGFLGIKNVITALCGIKYVLASSFSIDTVPGFPHVYSVRLALVDFDVFQQKREILSMDQQAELVQAFSKRNPFLRIMQRWGAFSSYPDMPLDVRDSAGSIIGHLDPDYYFRSFLGIDDDIANWQKREHTTNPNLPPGQESLSTTHHLGRISDDQTPQKIVVGPNGLTILDGSTTIAQNVKHNEASVANTWSGPFTDGLTPPSQFQSPHVDGSGDPTANFAGMVRDTQYRDKTGRMVRAFPTYMLWLIDEGGTFAGIKLFDNFYGLQSVVDFSLVRSEDIMADVLVLRVSNLYARLSTKFRDLLDTDLFAQAKLINTSLNRARNLASGLGEYLVQLDTVDLKPGVRVHLRMGYSSNPNSLETVFNGTITQVETGDIVTITAQSDAVELGAIVNSKNPGDSSGSKIDGSLMSGLWMSEPRDLMVRLLSMGGSVWREQVAHATQGVIFSENKFGVRHFGTLLYEPLSDGEKARQQARYDNIENIFKGFSGSSSDGLLGGLIGGVVGLVNGGAWDMVNSLWLNFHRKADYELYKRNIYPGNGLGIAQYLGGDLGDGVIAHGILPSSVNFVPTGVSPDGTVTNPATGEVQNLNTDGRQIIAEAKRAVSDSGSGPVDQPPTIPGPTAALGKFYNLASPFLKAFGITNPTGDDDLKGFDEVSFRAQTYMKSIWDLFIMCAGLLPNYIVATRPFMDRSTVFYGKPHWMYTSGVIPLSTGVGDNQADGSPNPKAPKLQAPDAELEQILKQTRDAQNNSESTNQFYERLTRAASDIISPSTDPGAGLIGVQWNGQDVMSLPATHKGTGTKLPAKRGKAMRGLHLPTDRSLAQDIAQHKQLLSLLPRNFQHPYYMDRQDKSKTLENQIEGWSSSDLAKELGPADPGDNRDFPGGSIFGEDANSSGALPASGSPVDPVIEEYYIAMDWDASANPHDLYGGTLRILAYNTRSRKGAILSPADKLPPALKGHSVALVSPDAFAVLEISNHFEDIVFGFADDSYPVGPITIDPSGFFNTTGLPSAEVANGVQPTSTSGPQPAKHATSPKPDLANMPDWMKNHSDRLKQTVDPVQYSLKFGYNDPSIPVNYTDPSSGLVDPIGNSAEEVFRQRDSKKGTPFADTGRTEKDATSIWNQLRTKATKDGYIASIFFKKVKDLIAKDFSNESVASIVSSGRKAFASELLGQVDLKALGKAFDLSALNGQLTGVKGKSSAVQNDVIGKAYINAVDSFLQFLWTNPYNRGWVVKTADVKFDLAQGISKDVNEAFDFTNLPYIGDVTGNVANFSTSSANALHDLGDGDIGSFVTDAAGALKQIALAPLDLAAAGLDTVLGGLSDIGVPGAGVAKDVVGGVKDFFDGGSKPKQWDFDRLHGAFNVYINQGPAAAQTWMLSHAQPGKDQSGVLERGVEEVKRDFFDPIYGFAKSTINSVIGLASGVLSLIRTGLMGLTMGLGMANLQQQQANLLNRAYNDSVYFHEGSSNPPDLLYLADNPFTREYAEPVVEVRQPFSRMHQINSFQHILHNGIQENLDGVATIITATSNGSNPVTVYFDKGAPTDRQIEMSVETGLWFDKPKGLFGNLIHPVETLRDVFKTIGGAPDALSAKRIALWHLKENLKNIYTGEILVLGDPSIRPHDMLYLGDVYEQMYGIVEVEQVVHHFTPELGFVTAITPNAVVTINDPGRWNMFVFMRGLWQTHVLRQSLRASYGVKDGKALYGAPNQTSFQDLAQNNESLLKGSMQYSGGMSSLVKDVTAASAIGGLLVPGGPVVGAFVGWKAAQWVIKNLLDQHGCYIQYLTKLGAPMDAGLSYNLGVAVGSHNVVTLFGDSLRFPIPVGKDGNGNPMISTNDLLHSLGWTPVEIDSLITDADMWTNDINKNILNLSGRQPDFLPLVPPRVELARVESVIDGQSFMIDNKALAPNGVRLGAIVAPPLSSNSLQVGDLGSASRDFLIKRLVTDQEQAGYTPTVALRISPTNEHDKFGRLVAWVFHNVPLGTAPGDRDNLLKQYASKTPQIEWDSFLDDGHPYTYNWEAVLAGEANIDRSLFDLPIPGQGAIGAGNQ